MNCCYPSRIPLLPSEREGSKPQAFMLSALRNNSVASCGVFQKVHSDAVISQCTSGGLDVLANAPEVMCCFRVDAVRTSFGHGLETLAILPTCSTQMQRTKNKDFLKSATDRACAA